MNRASIELATLRLVAGEAEHKDLGIAFVAPIFSTISPEDSFLLTAYHVVEEAHCSRTPIAVVIGANKSALASIAVVSKRPPDGSDFAILRITGGIPINPPVCAVGLIHGPIMIRGRPAGLQTEFSWLSGQCNGCELTLEGNVPVLDLSLPDAHYVSHHDSSGGSLIAHDVWRGISGGPVAFQIGDDLTIGGLFRRVTGAGRSYATPLQTIVTACEEQGLVANFDRPQSHASPAEFNTAAISAICEGLEDPDRERIAWDTISNLLFRGFPIVGQLEILAQNRGSRIDEADAAFISYYLGRLHFKRGERASGIRAFSLAHALSDRLPAASKTRLLALLEARRATEMLQNGNPHSSLESLRAARARLEALPDVPEEYVVLETTSLLGREATVFFDHADPELISNDENLHNSIQEHRNLIIRHPHLLKKQDVVSTSLQILFDLWHIDGEPIDTMSTLAKNGRKQARARKNSIFWCQMTLAEATALWLCGERFHSLTLFLLLPHLWRSGGLTVKHEGLSQLLRVLEFRATSCRQLVDQSHKAGSLFLLDPDAIGRTLNLDLRPALSRACDLIRSLPAWNDLHSLADDFNLE